MRAVSCMLLAVVVANVLHTRAQEGCCDNKCVGGADNVCSTSQCEAGVEVCDCAGQCVEGAFACTGSVCVAKNKVRSDCERYLVLRGPQQSMRDRFASMCHSKLTSSICYIAANGSNCCGCSEPYSGHCSIHCWVRLLLQMLLFRAERGTASQQHTRWGHDSLDARIGNPVYASGLGWRAAGIPGGIARPRAAT